MATGLTGEELAELVLDDVATGLAGVEDEAVEVELTDHASQVMEELVEAAATDEDALHGLTEETGAMGFELEAPVGPAGVEEVGEAVCRLSVDSAGFGGNENAHHCDCAAHGHCLSNYATTTGGLCWEHSDSGSGR